MKIRNYNDVMEYPVNYSFLKEETKKTILKYFKEQEELKEFYYKKHILKEQHKLTEEEALKDYLRLYQHQMTLLAGGKNVLSILGIKVEYNWPNHKHEWILATQDDALAYLEATDKPCAEKVKHQVMMEREFQNLDQLLSFDEFMENLSVPIGNIGIIETVDWKN